MNDIFNSYNLFPFIVAKSAFVLLIISLLIISSTFFTTSTFANAVESSIVHTNKTLYHWGDTIVITGIVKNLQSEKYVIKIFDPVNTSPIATTQFIPKTDGSFSKIFLGVGPLWGLSGNYTAILQSESEQLAETKFLFIANPRYGIVGTESTGNNTSNILLPPLVQLKSGIKVQNVKCMTNFQLLIKENTGQPVCVKTSTIARLVTQGWILPQTIKVVNSDYSIKYGINTGMLVAATYDATTNSVALSVNTTNGGYFNVQLPRSFIDSKDKSGVDNIWSVILDGKDIDYTEKKTDDSRILSFSFDDNTKKIVIIPYCSSFPC